MPRRAKYIDVKGLLEAINASSGDPGIKQRAVDFLSTDLSTLRRESEIRAAWGGLFAAIGILAPLHPAYRQSLEVCRKALRDYSNKHDSYLEAWEEARPKMVDAWRQCREIFRAHAPADVVQLAEPVMSAVAAELAGSRKGAK